jgi:nitrite reductase/ring-hydroxylating ferredoxin subunit
MEEGCGALSQTFKGRASSNDLGKKSPHEASSGISPRMKTERLVAIAKTKDLLRGRTTLVTHGEKRFACVRLGTEVHVLEDACPHEGHPLSMGRVHEGVLTCPWHNWKFELKTGRCLFGAESARRFRSELHGDEVFVSAKEIDSLAVQFLEVDFERAMENRDVGSVVRLGLRLSQVEPLLPFRLWLRLLEQRTAHGSADAAACTEAAVSLLEHGVITLGEALALVASESVPFHAHTPALTDGSIHAAADYLEALLEERRDEAIAYAGREQSSLADFVASHALPFLALKLWDGGAGGNARSTSNRRTCAATARRIAHSGASTTCTVRSNVDIACRVECDKCRAGARVSFCLRSAVFVLASCAHRAHAFDSSCGSTWSSRTDIAQGRMHTAKRDCGASTFTAF